MPGPKSSICNDFDKLGQENTNFPALNFLYNAWLDDSEFAIFHCLPSWSCSRNFFVSDLSVISGNSCADALNTSFLVRFLIRDCFVVLLLSTFCGENRNVFSDPAHLFLCMLVLIWNYPKTPRSTFVKFYLYPL